MSRTTQRPTMRDVSRLANVSAMTVSRVLANPDGVSEPTRLRVMAAVETLGYVPDQGAGALSSKRTNFVALVLPTLTNSNFADTAQGLADTLGSRYQLLIGYTLYRTDEEERIVRSMLSRRPEAIVIAGSHHSAATRRMLANASIPVVEVWDRPEPPLDLSVGFSNEEAGRLAARHLLDLGLRRIGALGSTAEGGHLDARGEARLRGFSTALRDAGLSDRLVLRHGAPPVSLSHGAEAIGALLDRAPAVEAVFAVSDVSAFGALMECRRRGIDVPGDLSIVGFGDFELGRQCEPPISTIGIDSRGIGTRTGERLLALFAQKGADIPRTTDLGVVMLPRGTSAPRRACKNIPPTDKD